MMTFLSASLFTRPWYCGGAYVRKLGLPSPPVEVVSLPVISLPVMVTDWTSFLSMAWRNFENSI